MFKQGFEKQAAASKKSKLLSWIKKHPATVAGAATGGTAGLGGFLLGHRAYLAGKKQKKS